ncbi:hypothetical protein OEB99_17905 [Actinotalea sp. M2MS4P-6]|nr:hypothetical protein [Actinotalea sp. M2MS4P-6]
MAAALGMWVYRVPDLAVEVSVVKPHHVILVRSDLSPQHEADCVWWALENHLS